MNKLMAVLYFLLCLCYVMGCASSKDYEVRMFFPKGGNVATGYVVIEGVKHPIEVQLIESDE